MLRPWELLRHARLTVVMSVQLLLWQELALVLRLSCWRGMRDGWRVGMMADIRQLQVPCLLLRLQILILRLALLLLMVMMRLALLLTI